MSSRVLIEDRRVQNARAQLAEIQRTRLLAAASHVVEQLGYTRAAVNQITRRARVSRRTFYELFEDREECLAAVLEDAVRRIADEIEHAGLQGLPWRERVRGGLWIILSIFDREPALARFCMVESLRGGESMLRRREEILRGLAAVIDEGSVEGPRRHEPPAMTGEGLVGAACAIVCSRLTRGASARAPQRPLTSLHGELMGLIVLPYLGPAAARREQARPAPSPPDESAARDRNGGSRATDGLADDPLGEIPMRVTYRTARVLEVIARAPGASNREVAQGAGIVDQGQISKLLSRLERLGLVANSGAGQTLGERNAWTLTATGERVARHLSPGALDGRKGGVAR